MSDTKFNQGPLHFVIEMVSTNHSQSHNLLQKIADKSEKNINPYFFERCTTVSQETKKQIEDLIFESDVLMESLREFFY